MLFDGPPPSVSGALLKWKLRVRGEQGEDRFDIVAVGGFVETVDHRLRGLGTGGLAVEPRDVPDPVDLAVAHTEGREHGPDRRFAGQLDLDAGQHQVAQRYHVHDFMTPLRTFLESFGEVASDQLARTDPLRQRANQRVWLGSRFVDTQRWREHRHQRIQVGVVECGGILQHDRLFGIGRGGFDGERLRRRQQDDEQNQDSHGVLRFVV
jgi:hypothetical protein